jgi:hypothetical protein
MNNDEINLLDTLSETDGIKEANVQIEVKIDIALEHTGEYDEVHQPIRERAVSKDEVESLIPQRWDYLGEIDVRPEGFGEVTDKIRLTNRDINLSSNDKDEDKVPKGVFNGIENIKSENTASMSDLKEVFDKNE